MNKSERNVHYSHFPIIWSVAVKSARWTQRVQMCSKGLFICILLGARSVVSNKNTANISTLKCKICACDMIAWSHVFQAMCRS
jgi:hypothetical protein